MILDPQQTEALRLMHHPGTNVFLSGMAGTGKTTLVQRFAMENKHVNMCATTGIAAINLQNNMQDSLGRPVQPHTIYRWAGIGIGPGMGESFDAFFAKMNSNNFLNAKNRIRKASILVIDEISMLPGRTLNYLDFHFKKIRESEDPFGGIKIIAVGDFLQLPPVTRNGKYDWAFDAQAWTNANFEVAYLTQIHRQDDPEFIALLNNFREGRITGETAKILQGRIARFPSNDIVRLMTHNAQVNKWNAIKLESIEQPEHVFEALTAGDESEIAFLVKNTISPKTLRLKVGARIMVTANLTSGASLIAANGETAVVTGIKQDLISIKKDDGKTIHVERRTWKFDEKKINSGTFTQFPLRLAYAMTIHKSQGLTLNKAIVDIRANRDPGQAYVAVSRVRNLQGLWLKDAVSGVFVCPRAINFYRKLKRK